MEGVDTTPGDYPGILPTFSGVPKTRKYMTMGSYVTSDCITTHNNSVSNLIRGVGERVLFTNKNLDSPIRPSNSNVFESRCGVYRDALVEYIGRQSPVSRDQFVGFYKGRRRTLYQQAVDGLALKPVRVLDSFLSTFVKAEKVNWTNKPDPAPRVIQPRHPRYNVEVGRYLLPLEHKVYDSIDNLFGSPTIMSKYNSVDQASIIVDKFSQFTKPVCIGLDASRFDQHVSKLALQFEHGFYSKIFKSPRLNKLLSWQITNHGYARAPDGMFKYVVEGCRMSGDMNTSLGNKFLMCLMAKAYMDTKDFKLDFINNGDDCLLFCDQRNLQKISDLQEYFISFGFKIVLEDPVYEIEHIEFCQCRPLLCNNIWRMVRNVKTCLVKDLTAVSLGHDLVAYRRWIGDVANCGLAFAGDVPVLGSFYNMLKRFSTKGTYMGQDALFNSYRMLSKGCTIPYSSPDDVGRYRFWLQTGIHPDAQLEIEQYFETASWGGDKRQLVENIDTLIKNGS